MRNFMKRRLPALLLAVVLLVGLTPAAFADPLPADAHEHVWSGDWTRNSTSHWHACTVDGCTEKNDEAAHDFQETSRVEPSCYKPGKVVETCTVCGYEKETTLSPTGDHNYSASWSYDNDQHWHACRENGCTAKADQEDHRPADEGVVTDPTCTKDGIITYTCSVCGAVYTRPGTKALGHSLDASGKCTRPGCTYQETTSYTVTFRTGSQTYSESVRVGASATMSGVPSKPT